MILEVVIVLTYQSRQPPKAQPFDILCPNHIMLDADGLILGTGPNVHKFFDPKPATPIFTHLKVSRPKHVEDMTGLIAALGQPLRLKLSKDPKTDIRGVMAAMGGDKYVLNFSIGIGLERAVQVYGLSEQHFAATDLAIEMLYLIEAKKAVTDANMTFNRKLYGAKIAAEEQALTDTLTGLKNRRALNNALQTLLSKGQHFSVVQMDLDFFKSVNDTYGHAAGDHVLKTVGDILRRHLRDQDVIVRLGGDEFVLIFAGLTDGTAVQDLCLRIIKAIEVPIPFEEHMCRISCSMGIFPVFGSYVDPRDILLNADVALYQAKNDGRGRCHIFEPSKVSDR